MLGRWHGMDATGFAISETNDAKAMYLWVSKWAGRRPEFDGCALRGGRRGGGGDGVADQALIPLTVSGLTSVRRWPSWRPSTFGARCEGRPRPSLRPWAIARCLVSLPRPGTIANWQSSAWPWPKRALA
jgi:Domain of unknown function (DUF3303)